MWQTVTLSISTRMRTKTNSDIEERAAVVSFSKSVEVKETCLCLNMK